MLYEKLEEILKKQNVQTAIALIADPNPESVAFHEKMGYHKVAHFSKCGYKFGRWYDILWLEKFIGDHADVPAPFIPIEKIS